MNWLTPDLARGVNALITSRSGPDGQSDFNVATHAGEQTNVLENRAIVVDRLNVRGIQWLDLSSRR